MRLPWFRCNPTKLLGALGGMGADEALVYTVALLRIYEAGGPVAESPRTLARRTGITERRASLALDDLLAAGKLERLADGRLDSRTTHDEIAWQVASSERQSKAGKSSAETKKAREISLRNKNAQGGDEEKPKENQGSGSTTVERRSNHKEEDRDREKKQGSDPNGSSGNPPELPLDPEPDEKPAPPVLTATDRLWAVHLPAIADFAGVDAKALRTFVGRCVSKHGPDATEAAMIGAIRTRTGDPKSFITRALNPTDSAGRFRSPPQPSYLARRALGENPDESELASDHKGPILDLKATRHGT